MASISPGVAVDGHLPQIPTPVVVETGVLAAVDPDLVLEDDACDGCARRPRSMVVLKAPVKPIGRRPHIIEGVRRGARPAAEHPDSVVENHSCAVVTRLPASLPDEWRPLPAV